MPAIQSSRTTWCTCPDYDWDYDYQNTDVLTTTDFWSDGAGTGIYWLRYEMGAAAIIKILKEYPSFAEDFNRAYYARLDADREDRPRQVMGGVSSTYVDRPMRGLPELGWCAASSTCFLHTANAYKRLRSSTPGGWLELC